MITPPSSPSKTRDCTSPIFASPGVVLFQESPKRGLAPPAPSKQKKAKFRTADDTTSYALNGLVVLKVTWRLICNLGAGSFGTVDKIVFESDIDSPSGTQCSPEVAMKKIVNSLKQGPKGLLKEAANLGKSGCASGVAATDDQGNLYIFTSVAIPLTQIYCLGRQILDQIIVMTKSAIMNAPLLVVYDCKPANLGLVQKGTTTVVADPNGQPCAGPLTDVDSVVFLDLGNCGSPEEADGNFNPLLDDDAVETEDEQLKFRQFKCEMMEALLWNQFAQHPDEEKMIVAKICTKYEYSYARGPQVKQI
jgi:hypothetical protein